MSSILSLKENKFLFTSLAIFILCAAAFFYNLHHYSKTVRAIHSLDSKITKVNRIHGNYLSSVINKRGYQFQLDKEALDRYLEYNLENQQLIEEFEVEVQGPVMNRLFDQLLISNLKRRDVLNRHISYLDSMLKEEALIKIRLENPEILRSSLALESTFEDLKSHLETRRSNLVETAEKLTLRNTLGFVFLGILVIGFISNTFFQTRKNTLLEAETKNQEEILRITRNSELQFRASFQNAAIGMALVSKQGKFEDVNRSLCKLLGYTKNELISLTFQEITHPEDLYIDLEYAKQLLEKKIEFYSMEKRYFTKDGQTVWIHLNGTAVWNADGTFRHFIAQIENITKSKNAALELEERERKFRGIFNSTFQFIGFLETDGTLIDANETALDFAGLSSEDVVGKKFWDCFWWEISKETQDQLRLSIEKAAQGEFIQYEVEVWDKVKNPVTILFNLKPILDGEGKVTAIVPEGRLIQDIVDARKSLIEKNLELERFASVASHDLKEPLRMVINFLQLLDKKYSGRLDEKADSYIHFAVDAAIRMNILITDLLDFSKVGSENTSLEPIDLNELISEQNAYFSSLLTDCGGSLIFFGLPTIIGKKVPINLLFRNLIGNAIKYKSPDKTLKISIKAEETKDHWKFSVSDNGIGFDASYSEVIFEMFQRLHTREEYAGTGLGLSICKKIVEQHKGKIWAESKPQVGSTFHFTLDKFL